MISHDLTRAPIKGLIKMVALPVAIGFFFNTMYNVVDTYFAGQISTDALSALSISFPVFFLIIMFDSGTSTGVTALLANTIGEGKIEKAKTYIAQAFSFGIVLSVIVTILGLVFAPAIFRLLGAEENYLQISLTYMNTIFYGSVFFMMISVMNSVLQATGDTRTLRNFLIVGFFLNAFLDPWFLYGGFGVPAMGIRGIALATVLVQLVGCVYIFSRVWKTGLISNITWRHMIPERAAFIAIGKQAIPASLNMATIGVGIFVITYFISDFGKDAVAAYGIATRIEQIILMPTIGITIATLSIIGQNNGAKKFARVKETFALTLRYSVIAMAMGAILVFFFREQLMSAFTQNTAVIAIGSHYLVIACLTFLAYPLLFISVSALQGMERPFYPVGIGLYRQIVAPVLVFSTLTGVLHWGIDGVWWGIWSITWSAALITLGYMYYRLKKLPLEIA